MERKIEKFDVEILTDRSEGWRVKYCLAFRAGKDKDVEYFHVEFIFPWNDLLKTPDEIKIAGFEYLKSGFKDIAAQVEKSSFDSLQPER